VTALTLFFAAAVAAPPYASIPKATGACSAVTAADLESALGRRFGRGTEESRGPESTCDYAAGNGMVTVSIQRLRQKIDLAAEVAGLTKEIQGATVRLVENVEGTALYVDIGGAGTQLHVVRADGEYVMVSVLGFGDAAHVSEAVERLVRVALGRL